VLIGAAVLFGVAFVWIESRAAEPILPLHLFKNPIFRVGNAFGFLTGMVLFGTIIFLPLYLQAVKGFSPTESGLALLPAVIGIFSTSISAGQMISRTGRYKIYPVLGAGILLLAMVALTRLSATTPYWQVGIAVYVWGAGIGLTMQTILTAVQNAVDYRDLGTATGAVTFFRQIGGAIGAAAFGAMLSSRLASHLADEFGGRLPAGAANDANNVQAIQHLSGPVRAHVLDAFSHALDDVFLVGIPIVAVAFFVALALKEIPLRSGAASPAAP
jgi:predicted MFS family arabinose efflux permease